MRVLSLLALQALEVAVTSAFPSSGVSSLSSRQAASQPSSTYCGAPNEFEVLAGTPWIVFSMNYNYQSIEGSCCTGYYETTGSGDSQLIHWSSIWDIDATVNPDLVKGYSFVGLTQNLQTRLNAIASIPTTYDWTVTNSTAFKGNVVYDFMTSDTKGDETSSAAQELMLWIKYEGGQIPLGYDKGPVATIDGLYGKDGWKLYQGLNTDTGITVSSLLAPENDQFGTAVGGSFEGDIKDWLLAVSKQGVYSESTFVNVGNAGMEPFWGTVTFDNSLGLRINL
ncbi:hypothetical protein QQX98_009728 [Neonectria punicea]|uniref:Uncharacterized protein n=1 Tax=Neonectria punicea TaxID=979145 RepID=A0ABR1GRJ7_9HYPO